MTLQLFRKRIKSPGVKSEGFYKCKATLFEEFLP